MDAKEFTDALALFASTQKAQEAAQQAHKGKDAGLKPLASLRALLSQAAVAPEVAEAALKAQSEQPNVAAALTSKAALAAAEQAHAESAAPLRAFLATRPAVVVDGAVVAHGNPALIAQALAVDGAALVVPAGWPEVFPSAARLLFSGGVVSVDPEWSKQAEIAELEREAAMLAIQAARPAQIAARLEALRKEG